MKASRALLSFLSLACALAQVPKIYPRVVMPNESVESSFWLSAPDIAIVKVTNSTWTGPEVEITPPGKLVVRLVQVDAEVETVIKGKLSPGQLSFYYFANVLSPGGYTTIKYWLDKGERYVVFLREDGQVWRTMADVSEFKVQVLGGRQNLSNMPGPLKGNPGIAIAYATLRAGSDHERGFASSIPRAHTSAAQFAPSSVLVPLLQKLLISDDQTIRIYACLTLSRSYQYRDPCLRELVGVEDNLIRPEIDFVIRNKLTTQQLVDLLKDSPLSLNTAGKVGDLAGDLEVFTLDRDAAVGKQACETLSRLFPERTFAACRDKIGR